LTLDLETTFIFIQHKDSAGILLKGVNHIYGRISVSWEREQTNNNDNVPKGINNVINEVMEYEPEILVPDIDDHVFTNEDGVDDDGSDDEEQEMTMKIGGLMTRPCLNYLKYLRNRPPFFHQSSVFLEETRLETWFGETGLKIRPVVFLHDNNCERIII
jgi:hypothetical protein